MIIKDDLYSIANCFFKQKYNYQYITEQQKEKYFFIFNRYFSKNYPKKAQLLNLKVINKVSAFDIWFHFMKDKDYPNWFWSKSKAKKNKDEYTEKEYQLLLRMFKIKEEDLDFLMKYKNDFVKEELKYFKKLEKGN